MILHQAVQIRPQRIVVLHHYNFRLESWKMKNKNKKVQGLKLPKEAQGKQKMEVMMPQRLFWRKLAKMSEIKLNYSLKNKSTVQEDIHPGLLNLQIFKHPGKTMT